MARPRKRYRTLEGNHGGLSVGLSQLDEASIELRLIGREIDGSDRLEMANLQQMDGVLRRVCNDIKRSLTGIEAAQALNQDLVRHDREVENPLHNAITTECDNITATTAALKNVHAELIRRNLIDLAAKIDATAQLTAQMESRLHALLEGGLRRRHEDGRNLFAPDCGPRRWRRKPSPPPLSPTTSAASRGDGEQGIANQLKTRPAANASPHSN